MKKKAGVRGKGRETGEEIWRENELDTVLYGRGPAAAKRIGFREQANF